MSSNGPTLMHTARQMGLSFSDEQHSQIIKKAGEISENNMFGNGFSLVETYGKYGVISALQGDHKEVAVIINTKNQTTLDWKKVATDLSGNMQAFNLDIWALKNGVNRISLNQAEADIKMLAAVYYNLATLYTLAGPSLRVAIR